MPAMRRRHSGQGNACSDPPYHMQQHALLHPLVEAYVEGRATRNQNFPTTGEIFDSLMQR